MFVSTQQEYWTLKDIIKKGEFEECYIKSAEYHKDITWLLVTLNIPFKRVSYGAGIYRLIKNDKSVCPHCSRKGTVK